MDVGTFIWKTFAVFLTLCIFSFLYKDNPFYKFAEHLVVGVSAGYFAMILYYNGLIPKLINPISRGEWWYFIPGFLGVLMWTRFSRNYSWLSRFSLACYIGIASGVAIPQFMQTWVVQQMTATMQPTSFKSLGGVNNLLVGIGVFSALVYFFFSKEHKGVFGGISKVGIYVLMIAFGAGFGLTVMGRVSLLIERLIYIKGWYENLTGFF